MHLPIVGYRLRRPSPCPLLHAQPERSLAEQLPGKARERKAREGGVYARAARALFGRWRAGSACTLRAMVLWLAAACSSPPLSPPHPPTPLRPPWQQVNVQPGQQEARVDNCVDFGERVGVLRVQAQASTESNPLEGFTPRCAVG